MTGAREPRLSKRLSKSKSASLLIPVERQERVVHQLTGGELRGLPAAGQGGNDVGREQRETEEPGCVGRDEAVRLGNLLEREAAILEQLVADPVGADHKTNEGRVRCYRLSAIVDDQSHLLAGAPEADRNG